MIGCLQRIEGVQYKRNTLQFNICLVIKPKATANRDDISHWQFWDDYSAGGLRPNVQAAYEALTLKINRYFYALEEQCGFLSRSLGHHEGVEKCVKLLRLKSIYKQLHESGMCILSFPNSGSLYLRVCFIDPINVFKIISQMLCIQLTIFSMPEFVSLKQPKQKIKQATMVVVHQGHSCHLTAM